MRTRVGRVLGIDYGTVRIGIALSDPLRSTASPLAVLERSRCAEADVEAIAGLVADHEATEVVVGLPVTLRGERGPAATEAERFAESLRAILTCHVTLWDERLSSAQAEKAMLAADESRRRRRGRRDKVAAAITLQSYLDACARGR